MMLRHIGLLKQAAVVENALLCALESGIHTGDFGDPSLEGYKGPVGTAEFTRGIVERLGKTPKTVPSVPVPEQNTPTFTHPAAPARPELIRTFTDVPAVVSGCDLYVETTVPAGELAGKMQKLAEGMPFALTLISNRGTQVWPSGSVYTEVVDYMRVRFEVREDSAPAPTQAQTLALLQKVASQFTVANYELLRTFGGVRGYSLAQGQ
jgi:isocitrate dehydrogenase